MRKCYVKITDPHFRELHHALGCPWPDEIMGDTYRNYFATDAGSTTAARFRASPHWTNGTEEFGMDYFHVTEEGKRALKEHMRGNVEIPARYCITFRHHEGSSIVTAKSRSAAKYAAYLDADIDWPFMEYAAEIKSVRLHSPASRPLQST